MGDDEERPVSPSRHRDAVVAGAGVKVDADAIIIRVELGRRVASQSQKHEQSE
jgi:hypothetical protein